MNGALVIGVGHPHRGDDAAGLEVARRLREGTPEGTRILATSGDATTLMEAWRDYDIVTIVDSVVGAGEVGDIVRVEPDETGLETAAPRPSTHSFGVAEAIALGRQLDELPRHLVVYGIEGRRFGLGVEMSPEVRAAVEALATRLCSAPHVP